MGKRAEPQRASLLPRPHDNPGVFDNSYPSVSSPLPPAVSQITSFLDPTTLLSPLDVLQLVCCFLHLAGAFPVGDIHRVPE